ncbi:MAG: hypothetical protein JO353_06965, partial [Phycisphaerae bacterium]|nr:hypothetical protein [Phycisphaerae bacterium]
NGIGHLIEGLNKVAEKLHLTAIGGADELHNLGNAFYATGNDALAAAGENWKQFSDGTNAKAAARSIQDIQNASQSAAQAIANDAATMNTAGTATEDWANKLKAAEENTKKITETLAELHKAVDTFGQTDSQKKLFDLKAMGASPEQLAEAQSQLDKLSNLQNAKKAADAIAELQKQIDQVGMTEGQNRIADLKLPGVDPSSLEQLKAMGEHLDALKDAQKVIADTTTPMEKYEQQIGKLSDLLNAGVLDWDHYSRGVRAARAELEKANETKPPDLFASGSAAAEKFEYELRHQRAFDDTPGSYRQNAQKNDEVPKLQLGEQQETRRILQRIENELKDTNADPTQTVAIV